VLTLTNALTSLTNLVAYLKLDRDICLIIFDEAHHATKGHPYARIMREYFDDLPESTRPSVMGLTASPLDIE